MQKCSIRDFAERFTTIIIIWILSGQILSCDITFHEIEYLVKVGLVDIGVNTN